MLISVCPPLFNAIYNYRITSLFPFILFSVSNLGSSNKLCSINYNYILSYIYIRLWPILRNISTILYNIYMFQCLLCSDSLIRIQFQHSVYQVKSIQTLISNHSVERNSCKLWELMTPILHWLVDLWMGSPSDLEYLINLVYFWVSLENGSTIYHFYHYTAYWPYINGCIVLFSIQK